MTSAGVGSSVSPCDRTAAGQKTVVLVNRDASFVPCDSKGSAIASRVSSAEIAVPARQKSPKPRSSRCSPTTFGHYAGPKFSETPEPTLLPPPPHHWTIAGPESFDHATHQLRILLNVRA